MIKRWLIFIIFTGYSFAFSSEVSHAPLPLNLLMQKGRDGIPEGVFYFDKNGRVELLVETNNPEEVRNFLRLNGGSSGSFAGGILTVRLPVDLLSEFIKISSLRRVIRSRKLKPFLDISRQKVSADKAELGINLPRVINGTDTIVGIVDTGIDYTHPDFKNPDGSTRIIALWDQTTSGTPPPDFGYGAECTVDSINDRTCKEIDTDPDYSHGTHVAGIAVGSDEIYRGIAPGAMIVVVKSLYTEGSVIDGVDYVFRIAKKYKKPAVVNLSLGGNYGPHDGTSELVRALEELQGPGKVIVSACGNSGGVRIHAGGNTISEDWYVMDYNSGETMAEIDIWYDAPNALDFAIAALRQQNNTLCKATTFVAPGQSGRFSLNCSGLDCGSVYIDAMGITYPGNGNRNVLVILESPSNTKYLSRCRWALGVKRNSGDNDGAYFDAWITTDNGEFTDQPVSIPELGVVLSKTGDTDKTISIPADGNNIIAVGSYVSRTSWRAKDGIDYTCDPNCIKDDISFFSSKGPTRDGRIKPDITAPGEWIASARSSHVTEIEPSLLLPDNEHFMLAGTSMASPHVAGAVALLFDMNPKLTVSDVRGFLTNNADTDSYTVTVPNNTWGYGKLNVEKALQNVQLEAIDKTPPLIFDVLLEMKETSMEIYWKTDELANGAVELSFKNSANKVYSSMSYRTEHKFVVNGVERGEVFRIKLISADPRGNVSEIANLPGFLPNEGCGCNYSERTEFPVVLPLPLFVLIVLLFMRNKVLPRKSP